MSHTRIGLPPTRHPAGRLPPGPVRAKLLQLAHRGITLMANRPGRGERLLLYLCEGLAAAITELSSAEDRLASAQRALDVARLEIVDLNQEIDRLHFSSGEQTRRVEGGVRGLLDSQEITKLRPTQARSVVTG